MTRKIENVALQLSEYIVDLQFEDLPADVIQRAKTATLDAIGCMIMGSHIPLGPIIIRTVRDLGGVPESTVVTGGFKTSCVNAAMANATLLHADELDDLGGIGVGGHPGAVTVPPGLALAEREGVNGKAYITALVLGYDIYGRLLESIDSKNTLHLRSFSPAVMGCFPAATIAAKVLGFSVGKVNSALGLAGSTTGGLHAYLDGESQHMTKALLYGNSSSVGVQAALLAQQGFAGPPSIFQGKFSVINAVVDQCDMSTVTRDLGTQFYILNGRFKKYSAGGPVHAPLDALLKIMAEHALEPDDLVEVIVQVPTNKLFLVNDAPTLNINLQYLLAVAACDRKVELEAHSEERAKDPKVLELKKRIRLSGSPEIDRDPQLNAAGIVEVKTRRGQSFTERVDHPKGTAQNPMSQQEMEEKFISLSRKVVSPNQAQHILDTVANLEDVQNVRKLADLVRGE